MANINISIPDEIHKDLKIAAVLQQQPLKTLIIETLEHYVSDSPALPPSASSPSSATVSSPRRVRKNSSSGGGRT